MKKRLNIFILLALVIMVLFSSCAAQKQEYYMDTASSEGVQNPGTGGFADDRMDVEEAAPEADYGDELVAKNEVTGGTEVESIPAADRKITYYANVSLETKKFDEDMNRIKEIVEKYNGFTENSEIYGTKSQVEMNSDYIMPRSDTRQYYITVRIPAENYKKALSEFQGSGNLTYFSESSQDRTSEYMDIELRKETLEVEIKSVMRLLEKAETLEDIMILETRLTSLRYELETLERSKRSIDDLVNHSTISINLSEVRDYYYVAPEDANVGERIKEGLSKTLRNLKNGFFNVVVGFTVNLPYIIIWAIVIIVAFILIKKAWKKAKLNQDKKLEAQKKAQEEYYKAQNQIAIDNTPNENKKD